MPRPPWLTPLYEPACYSLGGFVTLTNLASAYDGINAARGLGVVRVDFTNVTRVDFWVDVNKIGTGTQSWQLWNVTDGSELAVIDDAGATGNKTLSVAVTSGLPTGEKTLRVRAKSTVSTDDPLYYGAYIKLS